MHDSPVKPIDNSENSLDEVYFQDEQEKMKISLPGLFRKSYAAV